MRIETVGAATTERALLSSGEITAWKVGAIIDAVAQRDAGSGSLWLDTPYGRLPAVLQQVDGADGAGPAGGEALQLRVLRTSPGLEFETVEREPAAASRGDEAVVGGLLRYLPRQSSPMPLLANLGWLARGDAALNEPLPANVLAAASRLWNALPEAKTLSDPQQLAAAIARSGVQLEANLAAGAAADTLVQSDLKALLLMFQRALIDAGEAEAAAGSPTPGAGTPASNTPGASGSDAIARGFGPAADGSFDSDGPGLVARGTNDGGGFANATQSSNNAFGMSTLAMKAFIANASNSLPAKAGLGHDSGFTVNTPPPSAHAALTPLDKLPATLTVLDSIRDQLTELTRQATGALARMNVIQLSNAAAGGTNAVWLVEIPVRHEERPDMVRLKFERERRTDGDSHDSESWSVDIALDLGPVGPMHAHVSFDKQRINVHLRADSAALLQSFQQHSDILAQRLIDAGLRVSGITCRAGMPATDRNAVQPTLLDVHA